jgi:hypothetical protein
MNPKTSVPLSLIKGVLRKSHGNVFDKQWGLLDRYVREGRCEWEKRAGDLSELQIMPL